MGKKNCDIFRCAKPNIKVRIRSTKRKWLFLLFFVLAQSLFIFYIVIKYRNIACDPAPHAASHQTQVILVTFGRSGSSFTSALINFSDDVFYIFEPLTGLFNKNIYNQTTKLMTSSLTCDFTISYVNLINIDTQRDMDSTKRYFKCLYSKTTGFKHLSCFQSLREECEKARVVFVKTIRMRVQDTETLLEKFPNLKIIYLVRDPRAVLKSQARVFKNYNWTKELKNKSLEHCTQMQEDLSEIHRLQALFPGRLKGIRYEEGATNPYKYAKDLYTLIGLNFTVSVQEAVRPGIKESQQTRVAKARGENPDFVTVKKDSRIAMNAWRSQATIKDVLIIDHNCGHLYSNLGYKFIESEKVLKSNSSLVTKPALSFFQTEKGDD